MMNENDKYENEEYASPLDLSVLIDRIWKAAIHFLWLILLLTSVGALFFWYRAKQSYVPVYRAEAVCTISGIGESTDGSYASAKDMAAVFPYLVSNSILMETIEKDVGVSGVPIPFAQTMENSNLLTLSVTSRDPQLAYDTLISTIENYPVIAEYVFGRSELHIVCPASVPSEPVNVSVHKQQAGKGAFIGFAAAMLFVLLYAMTRKTVTDTDDIEKNANLRVLASVPQIRFKKRRKAAKQQLTILNDRIGYGFVETYRTIRTRIEHMNAQNKTKVIVVTSAVSGEGKTTTAVNLALSLAANHKKVVLMDCDLRKPSVRELLKIEGVFSGIGAVLKGKLTASEALYTVPDNGLMVLAGKNAVDRASEQMSSHKMEEIIDELREKADYIIIDTPPSGVMSDASSIARFADGVLFVVRQDYSRLYHILQAIEGLSGSQTPLLGCILNGVESTLTDYFTGYHYGDYQYGRYGRYGKYGYSRYGYGGYGEKRKTDKNEAES